MTVPKSATEKTVLEKFEKLSSSEQIQFLDLHDSGNTEKSVWRIFRTNCMNVCGFAELGVEESAVYNSISRINHSCSPNAVWSCKNGNVRRQEARACRNITFHASPRSMGKSIPINITEILANSI